MTTAEELEKFKEPGKFELLATAVLCKAETEYRAILHTGMNAKGQTKKSPVDGFCRVPGSIPPHFVLVEHTVEQNLEKKWLFDHRTVKPAAKGRRKQLSESDDGDLLKAGHLARSIETEFPDAKFTVVLTTNQGLKPDFCLQVEKKAQELEISVDFWDRSRIARFLDTAREGQWLRKEYLGIAAEMLSDDLLRDLCYKSLDEYKKQFITNPDQWVSRQIDQQVERGIDNQSYSIQLLIGNSGSGKSAAAYQTGKKYLEADGYSLWLSENVLTASDSLTSALNKVLHDLYPSLMPNAGREALRLLKDGKRILLIADDINRTDNPAKLLQKLVNWSKPISSSVPNAKPSPLQHLLVCPVWSDVVRSIIPEFNKTSWINSIFIEAMLLEEGVKAVKDAVKLTAIELTNTEATALAEKLGNDPILIGFFTSLLPDPQPHELNYLAENVIDYFVKTAIDEVAQIGNLLRDEYNSALSNLAVQMLQNRKLNPRLTDLKNWFGDASEDMNALRALLKHGKLCQIDNEKLVFRHDRLREALLIESMGYLLNNNAEPFEIFWEPYYAEIIGQAIIKYPQNEEFLRELCTKLPLSLLEGIRHFAIPSNQYHQAIYRTLQDWVDSKVSSDLVPESILGTFYRKLIDIDSHLIINITENLPKYRSILLSRIRNGCTISGVDFCIMENQHCFAPLITDGIRDQVIEQAKYNYKEKILDEIQRILKSSNITDADRAAALTLAGFLEFFELENEILICWQLIDNKAQFLPNAIWAASQCCGDNPEKLLDPLIEFWAKLPDQKNDYGESWKDWFIRELSGFLPRYIHSHVLEYLIYQANKYESLRQYIAYFCQFIDTPTAVEFVVKSMAEIERNLKGKESVSSWMPQTKNLSRESLNHLFYLFDNPDSDDFIKQNISQLLNTVAKIRV
ncbi:hypothetical protein [Anabaena catenula]|uniref:Uncharacterized protein n=1 Tax=Anabaena catenula FACHB-362 TaxID=2692877 RepID=A0ABR8JFR9_9NOST|nr:hypothetical protein [Anabaena catenula]MBD2695246.1 hypothetical protein [Anabaena catenula FACHB-362]